MIMFQAQLTIKKIENKSFPKKDGGMFDFKEATLVSNDKKPVTLVARIADVMEDEVAVGMNATFGIGISSYEGKDGRIWNNFSIVGKKDAIMTDIAPEKPKAEPQPTFLDDGDEIPF